MILSLGQVSIFSIILEDTSFIGSEHDGGEVSFRAHDCCSLAQGVSYEQSGWQNGYAVGAGIDYALTDKLILGVDYTHIDLGSKTGTGSNVFDDGSLGSNPETFKVKARADVVMARLSYKFGN